MLFAISGEMSDAAQAVSVATLESSALRLRDRKVHVRHETAQQLIAVFRCSATLLIDHSPLTKTLHSQHYRPQNGRHTGSNLNGFCIECATCELSTGLSLSKLSCWLISQNFCRLSFIP